jgi:hypothetical protein
VPTGSVINASVVISGNPAPFTYDWRRGSVTLAKITSNDRTNYFSFLATNSGVQAYRLVVTNLATILNPGGSSGATNNWGVTTIADSDRDGLPDSLETSLGLNPNDPADAMGDLDGDRMSNIKEYLAGTDLNNSANYLRIDLTTMPGMATVIVAAVSNRTYIVQYTDTLRQPTNVWSKLVNIPARTTNRVEMYKDPSWTTNRFYRLGLPAQP